MNVYAFGSQPNCIFQFHTIVTDQLADIQTCQVEMTLAPLNTVLKSEYIYSMWPSGP
jgi:hypothetical protein